MVVYMDDIHDAAHKQQYNYEPTIDIHFLQTYIHTYIHTNKHPRIARLFEHPSHSCFAT